MADTTCSQGTVGRTSRLGMLAVRNLLQARRNAGGVRRSYGAEWSESLRYPAVGLPSAAVVKSDSPACPFRAVIVTPRLIEMHAWDRSRWK